MNIRFVSSLTPEDENALAPAILKAVSAVLDLVAIPYAVRIDTADARTYEHVRAGAAPTSAFSPRGELLRLTPDSQER